VTNARLFGAIAVAAFACGAALWHFGHPVRGTGGSAATSSPAAAAPAIAPAALYAAAFTDPEGASRSLGQFQGRVLVLNFWATWCGPCRAEMPAFSRLHSRWAARGVQFVGLSDEPAPTAARFGRDLAIAYPLWTGGEQVLDLSRRLGNHQRVLPHTVIIGPSGGVLEQRVGPYTEDELESRLQRFASK
jgi:thiol-disulfide isomerase/thioredoxin